MYKFTGKRIESRPLGKMVYTYKDGKLVNKQYKLFWYYKVISWFNKLIARYENK